jgi:hypothetical protein
MNRAVFGQYRKGQFFKDGCEGDRQVRCQGFIYSFVFSFRSGCMFWCLLGILCLVLSPGVGDLDDD